MERVGRIDLVFSHDYHRLICRRSVGTILLSFPQCRIAKLRSWLWRDGLDYL